MWIIKCTEFRTNRNVIVGPVGTDDQALKVARELEAADGRVVTDVRRSDVLTPATDPVDGTITARQVRL